MLINPEKVAKSRYRPVRYDGTKAKRLDRVAERMRESNTGVQNVRAAARARWARVKGSAVAENQKNRT